MNRPTAAPLKCRVAAVWLMIATRGVPVLRVDVATALQAAVNHEIAERFRAVSYIRRQCARGSRSRLMALPSRLDYEDIPQPYRVVDVDSLQPAAWRWTVSTTSIMRVHD